MRYLAIIAVVLLAQGEPPAIKVQDAKRHVGRTVTVCGTVMAFRCGPPDGRMLLDLDTTSRTEGVTIAVEPANRDQFGPRIEDRLLARSVCATGVLAAKEKARFLLAIERPEQMRVQREPSPVPVVLEPLTARACDDGVQAPKQLSSVAPVYPQFAMRQHLEGVTLLDGVVTLDGRIGDIALVLSSGTRELDIEAAKSFKRWTFAPGTLNGRPVPVVISVQIAFTMR
jgi:TonB family protein